MEKKISHLKVNVEVKNRYGNETTLPMIAKSGKILAVLFQSSLGATVSKISPQPKQGA